MYLSLANNKGKCEGTFSSSPLDSSKRFMLHHLADLFITKCNNNSYYKSGAITLQLISWLLYIIKVFLMILYAKTYITQLRCMQEQKFFYLIHMQVIQFVTILFEIIVVVVNDLIK